MIFLIKRKKKGFLNLYHPKNPKNQVNQENQGSDNKKNQVIEQVNGELVKTQEFKKGLLQQLFV